MADNKFNILMEGNHDEIKTLVAQIEDNAKTTGIDFRQYLTTAIAKAVTKEINTVTMQSEYGVKMAAGAVLTVAIDLDKQMEVANLPQYIAEHVLRFIA